MKRYFILLLLAISVISCKKEKQEKPEEPIPVEASIQAKWSLKSVKYEYFNSSGATVYSDEDILTTGNIYQFGETIVTYGDNHTTAAYSISTNGSKKIITINFSGAPVTADIKTLDKTDLLLYSNIDSNGANTMIYHDGTLTQYTRRTVLYTFKKI